MSPEAPSRAYYAAVQGPWVGPLELRVTSWRAFFAQRMGLFDRLSVLSVALATPVLGPFRLETSVDCSSPDEVVHTTRVSKWGATFLRTRERLVLAPNGRDATMFVQQFALPFPWRPRDLPAAAVVVDEDALGASYRFPFLGAELRQRGERSPDGTRVTLTQETAFWRGVQALRRPG